MNMTDCRNCGKATWNESICDNCAGIKKQLQPFAKNKPCPCGSGKNFKNCHIAFSVVDEKLFYNGEDVTSLVEIIKSDKTEVVIYQDKHGNQLHFWGEVLVSIKNLNYA